MATHPHPPLPIPTTYHGIHFRSKLEARWALALDRLAALIEARSAFSGHALPALGRTLSDDQVRALAEAAVRWQLETRGRISVWLATHKKLVPADRAAVLLAWGELTD